MNKYKKLLTDTGLFMVSSFASKILVFLMLPLYTNILSTDEYAIADLITATVSLVFPVMTFAISEAALRYAFEKNIDRNCVLWFSLLLVFASSVILAAVKPIVAYLSGTMYDYWWYFVLCYITTALHTVFTYFARGCNKTKVFAVSGIIHTVVLLASNILCLVVFKLGLSGYLLSIIVSYLLAVVYIVLRAPFIKEIFNFSFEPNVAKQMLKYSIPMIPSIVAWWFINISGKYMIIYFLNLSQSGIYSVAYKIPTILTVISSLFTQAWQISAFSNYGEEDNEKFVGSIYNYYHCFSVMLCAGLIICAKPLGYILFANEYFVAWKCVPILLIAFVFSGLSGFLASIFTASKQTKHLFTSTVVGAILNIALNLFFIKWFGIIGAAYTTLIGFFATWLIRLLVSNRIMKLKLPIFRHFMMYALLVLCAFYVYNEFALWFVVSIVILGLLLFLNIKEIKSLFVVVCNKFLKRKISN